MSPTLRDLDHCPILSLAHATGLSFTPRKPLLWSLSDSQCVETSHDPDPACHVTPSRSLCMEESSHPRSLQVAPPHSRRPSVKPSIPPLPPYLVWATHPSALIIINQPWLRLSLPSFRLSCTPQSKDSQVQSTSKQMARPGWASLGVPSQAP